MGRAPCCDKASVKKGPWSPEEDATLKDYIEKHGTGGNWIALPQKAGLRRCGKSCRLRWLNYLRPNIKHGDFTEFEDRIICTLYASIGSRWSVIAAQLPGRTDNDIKNYWNTKLKKKLMAALPPLISQAQRATSISPLVSTQANSRFLLSMLPHLHSHVPPPSLASPWLSAPCSLPPALDSPSTNEISFGNPLLQYPIVKDGGTIAYERACQDAAFSSSEPSNYNNFSISTSSTIGSGANSDQSVSYECFPYPGVEEKENLVPTSSTSGGWSQEGVVHREWPAESAAGVEDYGFEEIKKLISTNISTESSFLFDENHVEKSVYY